MYQHQYQQYQQPAQMRRGPAPAPASHMMPQQPSTVQPYILTIYYSPHCNNSLKLRNALSRYGEISQMIYYVSLEGYYKDSYDGIGRVLLKNGQVVEIPQQINRTPAFSCTKTATGETKYVFGADSILEFLGQYIQLLKKQATKGNAEVYEYDGFKGNTNVISDTFTPLDELNRVPNMDDPRANGPGINELMAQDGIGLLGQPLAGRSLNDQPDQTIFGGKVKDRDRQSNTTYNNNQFIIPKTVQSPDQFPIDEFFEGQTNAHPHGMGAGGSIGSSYNPNEFAPPPPTTLPRHLTAIETSTTKRGDYAGLEHESKAMINNFAAQRDAVLHNGGGTGAGGQHRLPRRV